MPSGCPSLTLAVGGARCALSGLVLPRSPQLRLGGNFYGAGGRHTTLQQCLYRNGGSGGASFGAASNVLFTPQLQAQHACTPQLGGL